MIWILSLVFFVGWFVLWVLFLAVMELKAQKDAGLLTPDMPAYKTALAVLAVGYVVDFVINATLASLLFLEPPFQLTVTARCSYHLADDGYRGNVARWLCRNLLDPFQKGGHCH